MIVHATLDDFTKLIIALTGLASALAALLSARNGYHLKRQDKDIKQLSQDVNGRVNQLVDAEAAKAKLEVIQEVALRGHPTRWDDDPIAKGTDGGGGEKESPKK